MTELGIWETGLTRLKERQGWRRFQQRGMTLDQRTNLEDPDDSWANTLLVTRNGISRDIVLTKLASLLPSTPTEVK